MSDDRISAEEQAFADEIAPLSEQIDPGADAVHEIAIQLYKKEMAKGHPPEAKFFPRAYVAPFAFSYAGLHRFEVHNPDTGQGFSGRMILTPDDTGEKFVVSGVGAFPSVDEECILSGFAMLDDRDLAMVFEVENAGMAASFEVGLAYSAPVFAWMPSGNIMFQQAPDDPGLNGDIQLTPEQQEDGNTTFNIFKLPRLNKRGQPVFEGVEPNRKIVYDCFFWRGEKWYRIKDPTLKVPGQKELIDLRDGSKNPNYGPATTDDTERLDKLVFPTGWDDFWKGFDKATRVQLQGLAITLSVMTGVNLAVWQKIRRLRDQGKSWSQIWDECWIDILLVVGLAILMAIPFSKLLGKLFGPFIRRLRSRLLRPPPIPPIGGPPLPPVRPPIHPPIPPRYSAQDLINILKDYLAGLREMMRRLIRERRQLRSPSGKFSGSARFKEAELRRLTREIKKVGEDIAGVINSLKNMGA